MTRIQYRKADVDGFNVFYREAGRADAPVLLQLDDRSAQLFHRRDPCNLVEIAANRIHSAAFDLIGRHAA